MIQTVSCGKAGTANGCRFWTAFKNSFTAQVGHQAGISTYLSLVPSFVDFLPERSASLVNGWAVFARKLAWLVTIET